MLGLAKLLFIAIAQIPFAAAAPVLSPLFNSADAEPPKEPSDPSLWLYLGVSAALVLSGGAFAGLTIALMGQVSFLSNFIYWIDPANRDWRCRMKSTFKSSRNPARTTRKKMRPVFSTS